MLNTKFWVGAFTVTLMVWGCPLCLSRTERVAVPCALPVMISVWLFVSSIVAILG
nr:hypothetical protein [Capnocytophaga canimorsus]